MSASVTEQALLHLLDLLQGMDGRLEQIDRAIAGGAEATLIADASRLLGDAWEIIKPVGDNMQPKWEGDYCSWMDRFELWDARRMGQLELGDSPSEAQ